MLLTRQSTSLQRRISPPGDGLAWGLAPRRREQRCVSDLPSRTRLRAPRLKALRRTHRENIAVVPRLASVPATFGHTVEAEVATPPSAARWSGGGAARRLDKACNTLKLLTALRILMSCACCSQPAMSRPTARLRRAGCATHAKLGGRAHRGLWKCALHYSFHVTRVTL